MHWTIGLTGYIVVIALFLYCIFKIYSLKFIHLFGYPAASV